MWIYPTLSRYFIPNHVAIHCRPRLYWDVNELSLPIQASPVGPHYGVEGPTYSTWFSEPNSDRIKHGRNLTSCDQVKVYYNKRG